MTAYNEPTVLPDDIKRSGDSRWPRRDEIWHAVDVYRTTSKTITTATDTAIDWDAEKLDTSSIHDNATNNTRLTAPIDGIYFVYASLRTNGSTTGVQLSLKKNGSMFANFQPGNPATSGDYDAQGYRLVSLKKDEYVEIFFYHTTGSDRSVICSTVISGAGMYRVA
jgi:hypothetical protein